MTGQDVDAARKALEAAGFKVKVDRPLISFSNTVDTQSVPAGQNAPKAARSRSRPRGCEPW